MRAHYNRSARRSGGNKNAIIPVYPMPRSYLTNLKWFATELAVSPIDDLRPHDHEADDCWCNPTLTQDGILVHNSADKREIYERGEMKYH